MNLDASSGSAAPARRGLGTALVAGPSMLPTLADGDALLVRWGAAARPGDVVVARFPARPGLLVVKRAVRPDGGLWWVEGDSSAVADDSRRYGPAEVLGRVVLRWWPLRRLGRPGPPPPR
ncbi:MAG TPA: S26 family signal peptidase [Mycobacteriales bacterium]|nr:S26 family signal peptidase [Mycobacteriales bacterium]